MRGTKYKVIRKGGGVKHGSIGRTKQVTRKGGFHDGSVEGTKHQVIRKGGGA